MKKLARKTLYWGAFLSLGPITGPLAEGVFRNWRKRNYVLAGLYCVAIVTSALALPTLILMAWNWNRSLTGG